MSGVTPGQAAYEARRARLWLRHGATLSDPIPAADGWDRLTDNERADEEAGAQAAIAAAGLTSGERDLVLADLGELLEVLGLGDYARPQSPHEVFRECLAAVRKLRGRAGLDDWPDRGAAENAL